MNTGNRGKFSERIKRIVSSKKKIRNDSKDKIGSFKRILLFPLMLIDKKIYTSNSNSAVDNKIIKYTQKSNNVFLNIDNNIKNIDIINKINKKNNFNNINLININNIKLNENVNVNYNKIKLDKIGPSKIILPAKNSIKELASSIVNVSSILKNQVQKSNNNLNVSKISNKQNNDLFVAKESQQTNKRDNDLSVAKNDLMINSSKKNDWNFQYKVNQEKKVDINSKIVADISKYLIKQINNLDAIESDLYVLSKFDGNKESLDKCREYISKLHALQNKLNKIRKQFNIFKENIDFDDILMIDDKMLLDKLVVFRDSINNDIAMQTTKNYKLLDEYKYLYTKIDKVVNDAYALEEEVKNRKIDLEKTNVSFNEFQKRVYSFDKIEEETSRMLEKQNGILDELKDKVATIDVTKKVDYIYNGFTSVLLNGLKLAGLYMLSPFKKSIPGIATATLATKKTMENLLDTMNIEKRTKFIYSATDYGMTLSIAINDLENLDNLIASTISDISSVKRELISKFGPYASNLSKYNYTLKKINKMEKQIINDQVKVRLIAEKMKNKKRLNENTLVKVRKLNNKS